MPFADVLTVVAAASALTSGLLVALHRPRWLLAGLLVQYLTLIWLAQGPYGLVLGLVKAVTGVLTVLILGLSVRGIDGGDNRSQTLVDRPIFRAVAALITLLAGLGLRGYGLRALPQLAPELVAAGTWLLVSGLVQTGLFSRPLRVGIGVLTFLSGFEIFYASVEPSLAVAAMLAGVHLGLGLMTGYLVRSQTWEPTAVDRGRGL